MFKNSIHGFLTKEKHLTQRINSCDLLKKRNENDPFLKRLTMKNGLFTTISSGKDRRAGM